MLTDTQARKIASAWHGGGGSSLYVLSSTGAITADVNVEIGECLASIGHSVLDDAGSLWALNDYCFYHGVRGPQEGWSKLTW